jgi:uncharacterized membrane protein YfcA
MIDQTLLFIALSFLLAGFVKGVLGLGLPTVSMGLLALAMPPAQAAALLIVPSLVTNVWQMLAGPDFARVVRRLWSMMAGVCIGTWAGAGLLAGMDVRLASAGLGICLVLYAVLGFASIRWTVQPNSESWQSPLMGTVTGLITAATGTFVIPGVPYLQAIGLQKEELVQALGLSFTVSTFALAGNLAHAGVFNWAVGLTSLAALIPALVGMYVGQVARGCMPERIFRFAFLLGLLALGTYLLLRALA